MRIAVTGGLRQLVLSMQERGPALGQQAIAVGPPALDLAAPDDAAIHAALAATRPEAIVNAVAYTAVDRAESERDIAFAINAESAGAVARAAAKLGVPMMHISTDYVFAGDKAEPYVESDPTGPAGVYGASKLGGETAGSPQVPMRRFYARPGSTVPLAPTSPRPCCTLRPRAMKWAWWPTRSAAPPRRSTWPRRQWPWQPTSRLDCGKLASLHGLRLPDWRESTRAVVSRLGAEQSYR